MDTNEKLCSCGKPIIKGRQAKWCYDCRAQPKKIEDTNCIVCHINFHPKRRNSRFCSKECFSRYYTKSFCKICGTPCPKRAFCKLHRQTKTKIEKAFCKECLKVFQPKKRTIVYCSRECYLTHNAKPKNPFDWVLNKEEKNNE